MIRHSSGSASAWRPRESIVHGHHLNVTSIAEHKRFWIDALGGTPSGLGNADQIRLSNVLILLREQKPTGGTKGTTVNHIAFQVPGVRTVVEKLRAAGYPIVTKDETTNPEKDGVAFVANQNDYIAFVMAPDDTKVELVENRQMSAPISFHHVHYFTPDVNAMRDWYVRTFGARPGKRGSFETADLAGVNLTFALSSDRVIGTKGRVLDHIGFDVHDLESFCRKLESTGVRFDRPYTKLADRNMATAFIEDPWGTYIELTEGLDKD
jgi:catechol 2,3-dioxygenase-like lactoylglutathione lyase family enzyme